MVPGHALQRARSFHLSDTRDRVMGCTRYLQCRSTQRVEEKTQPPLETLVGPGVSQGDSQMPVQVQRLKEGRLKKLRMYVMIWPWKKSCKALKKSLVAEEQGIGAGIPAKH